MGLWIAIGITLAVLGSVMWVMPSPREKALIEMRQEAMRQGLKVRLLDKSLAASLFPWLEDYRGYTLYEKYHAIGKKRTSKVTKVARLSIDKNAHEIDHDEPVKIKLQELELISNLPETSEAVTFFSGGVAILWRERGGTNGVEKIDACLTACIKSVDDILG